MLLGKEMGRREGRRVKGRREEFFTSSKKSIRALDSWS